VDYKKSTFFCVLFTPHKRFMLIVRMTKQYSQDAFREFSSQHRF